jgi:DNA-binding HxlR family transcriptional regulator
MRHDQLADQNCAIARSAAILGERWVWVILRQAFIGARRFEDYQRGIGLARNILTDRLNHLVEHEVLERRPYAENAGRTLYEYRLTRKGQELFPIYVALMEWGNKWTDLPDGAPVELLHTACGHKTHPRVVCSECREDIEAHETQPLAGPGLLAYTS